MSTLLLVEDDADIRAILVDMLTDEGYTVIEAEDGQAAIRVLREHCSPPDTLCLVILDMMLPKADGVEVLQTLAELGHSVPVVAMSADPQQLRRASEAGADDTLWKPFQIERLLAVVERNCAR
jgi:DNA-binding response OmpR family regulator